MRIALRADALPFWRRAAARAERAPAAPLSRSLLTALALLCWLALTELIVALGWATRLPLLSAAAPAAFAVVAAGLGWRAHGEGGAGCRFALLAAAALILASIAFGALVDDLSYDGQDYHRDALYAMASGWNPYTTPHSNGAGTLWVSHYAKGAWMVGASLAALSGNFELGKAQNLLLMACASLLTFHVTHNLKHYSTWLSAGLAVLVALNPVNSVQLYTDFVDTQVGSLTVVLALLLYCYAAGASVALEIALAASIVLLLNIKLSSGLFIFILCGMYWIYLAIDRNRAALAGLSRAAAAGAQAGVLVGYNPYITNVQDHGHPLYPLAGAGAVNLLGAFAEDKFLQKNRLEKFLLSIASVSHHEFNSALSAGRQVRLKLPLSVSKSEVLVFYKINGPFMGGFGFFTSAALILLLLGAGLKLRSQLQSGAAVDRNALLLIAALTASVLAFPESWWARYVPQFWAVMVLGGGFLLGRAHAAGALPGKASLALLTASAVLILAAASAHQLVQQLDYRAQTDSLKQIGALSAIPLKVNFQSSLHRLRNMGIPVVQVDKLACPRPEELIGGGAAFCIDSQFRHLYRNGSPRIAALLSK